MPSKVFFHNIPLKGHAGCTREHTKASAFADAVARPWLLPPVRRQTPACERLIRIRGRVSLAIQEAISFPVQMRYLLHTAIRKTDFERVTDQVDRPRAHP